MKKLIWFLILSGVALTPGFSQVTGLWAVMDEDDGVEKSIVEIYEKDNKYNGRIIKLLPTSKRTHCEKCNGDMKGKPLTGMVILYDLKKTSNGGTDGKLLHPGTGKVYSLNVELESPDRLKLRGYLGIPSVGKTSYWTRVKTNNLANDAW